MQVLSGSLDTLSNQLKPEQFKHFKISYPGEKYQNILLKKGVYPYSYMDSMGKFSENQLPQEEALENKPISSKQYKHDKNVWKQLRCTTMQDYDNHYLKGDLLFLKLFDVWQLKHINWIQLRITAYLDFHEMLC